VADLEKFASLARELTKGQIEFANSQRKTFERTADKYGLDKDLIFADDAPAGSSPAGGGGMAADFIFNPATGKLEPVKK
jgi:hypothetical protein